MGATQVDGSAPPALSPIVTRSRITAGIANRNARLRPMVARNVIQATVPLTMLGMSWLLSAGELGQVAIR